MKTAVTQTPVAAIRALCKRLSCKIREKEANDTDLIMVDDPKAFKSAGSAKKGTRIEPEVAIHVVGSERPALLYSSITLLQG
jgi:hypothetical protein